MEAPTTCKHSDEPICDTTCECWCDACQEQFEERWDVTSKTEALCSLCGIPEDEVLTMERLVMYQYVHFYLPCPACTPKYMDLMKRQGLCHLCRSQRGDSGTCLCVNTEHKSGEGEQSSPSLG